jgi:hypothetical protein
MIEQSKQLPDVASRAILNHWTQYPCRSVCLCPRVKFRLSVPLHMEKL